MGEPPDPAPDAAPAKLRRRATRGLLWTATGSVAANVLRLGVLIVLGRLLSANDFGVVAAAQTVMLVLATLRDLGVGLALIQRPEIDETHVATAFTVSVGLGAILSVTMFAIAPLVEDGYGMPGLAPVVQMLSLLLFLRSLSSVSLFLCQRELRFRAIVGIDVAAYAAGSAVSLVLAALGAGPYALVGGYLLESLSYTASLLVLRPPRWRLSFDRRAFRDLLSFGGGQTVAVIANLVAVQGDNMVVGARLGDRQLGFYSRAYELVRFPSLVFQNVVGTVLFPTLSRVQRDRARVANAFRRGLFLNAVLLLPASAGLILLGRETLHVLLGPGWDAAVLPFQIMAVTMLLRASCKLGSIVARAPGGDVYGVAGAQVVYATLIVGGSLISARWGITGVAVTTAFAQIVNFLVLSWLGMRHSGLSWRGFAQAHLGGLGAATVAIAAAWPTAIALRAVDARELAVMTGAAAAGVVAVLSLFAVGVRRPGSDWAWCWQLARDMLRRRDRSRTAEPAA